MGMNWDPNADSFNIGVTRYKTSSLVRITIGKAIKTNAIMPALAEND